MTSNEIQTLASEYEINRQEWQMMIEELNKPIEVMYRRQLGGLEK